MSPPVVAPSRDDPWVAAASGAIGGPLGRHARGHPWWTPLRVVLAVACLAWLLAVVQKAPCAADGWNGSDDRYAQLCYSDLPYLYLGRGFAEGALPYRDAAGRYPGLEYPVLLGYAAWAGARVTQLVHGDADLAARRAAPVERVSGLPGVERERRSFYLVTAVLLTPLVLLAAALLAGVNPRRPWDALAFAAAPVLVMTGTINWDVLPVALVAGALWAHARGRPVLTGVLVGLGTAAKLYPALLLGALLVIALHRRVRGPAAVRAWAQTALAAGTTWLAVNLPALLDDPAGWRVFWTFNADRGADLGSLWLVARNYGAEAGPDAIGLASLLLFGAWCLGVLLVGLRAPAPPRLAQVALLLTLGFLLVNKVYSPQYVLWLLPLAALARPRWRDLVVWQAGELVYVVAVWLHLGGFTAAAVAGAPDPAYTTATLVRVAVELYLAAVVTRDVLRPDRDPVDRPLTGAGGPQVMTMRSNAVTV